MFESTLIILLLIAASAFFATSEIALAAARRLKLEQLAADGDGRARLALALQAQPGHFFTTIQIGLNAVAILAGILGEGAYAPYFTALLAPHFASPETAGTLATVLSFVLVTSVFILFADLVPTRIAIVAPERIALRIAGPMTLCIRLLSPLIWAFNGIASRILAALGLPQKRPDDVTAEDIVALAQAGADAGVVAEQEQQMIENVLELDTRTAPSSMTTRDAIVWLDVDEEEASLRAKLSTRPHSKYPVCRDEIDQPLGYVDAKDLLSRIIAGQPLALDAPLVHPALILPDTLTLSEILGHFRAGREDFALIINEYALIVGLITLNDLTSTLVGDPLIDSDEAQIVRRDADSWLIDGLTPIGDVETELDLPPFPDDSQYETVAGFMMVMLRKLPKRTDSVVHGGLKFEVIDVDRNRIDQLLVTRLPPTA